MDCVRCLRPSCSELEQTDLALGILNRYCAKYNLGDPEEALPTTDRARAIAFLTFMCANYNINTTDTLWQYFRVWKQRESLVMRTGSLSLNQLH